MGTDYSARCNRIDARYRRAEELIEQFVNGNRSHVMSAIAGADSWRLVAAIGYFIASNPDPDIRAAASAIVEAAMREKEFA